MNYEIIGTSLLPNCFSFCPGKYNKQSKKSAFLEVAYGKVLRKSLKTPKKVPSKGAQGGVTFHLLLVMHYKITSCSLLVAN